MASEKPKNALKRIKKTLSLSTFGKISKDAFRKSRSIENQLEADKEKQLNELTLLLLGSACSGKSTFVKQLRIHYGDGFPDEERMQFINQIHDNISGAANKIIACMKESPIQFDNDNLQMQADDFQIRNPLTDYTEMVTTVQSAEDITPTKGAQCHLTMQCTMLCERFSYLNLKCKELSAADQKLLLSFWDDLAFQKCYARLLSMACCPKTLTPQDVYFCCHMKRILSENYVPTHQDILQVRQPTMGVTEHQFNVDDFIYRVIDVAGQKSQRKKWIHLFENVTVIVFFVALSAFDEKLEEDNQLNSLDDSLQTFHEISYNQYLDKTDFLLFLNKYDLFTEKLKTVKFKTFFRNYEGENSPESCTKYIRELFHQRRPGHKQVFTHVLCATDVSLMGGILSQVLNIVAEINFRKTGGLF